MQNVQVCQDGGDFYVEEASSGKLLEVVSYAYHISDGDMEKAKEARSWFEQVYCPFKNYSPSW